MERQRGGAHKGQSEQGGIVQPPNCVGLTVCITARYNSLLPKALLICCLMVPPASSGKGGGTRREGAERFSLVFSMFQPKFSTFVPFTAWCHGKDLVSSGRLDGINYYLICLDNGKCNAGENYLARLACWLISHMSAYSLIHSTSWPPG